MKKTFAAIILLLLGSGCTINNCSIFGHSNNPNPMQEAELARLGHCNDLAKKLINEVDEGENKENPEEIKNSWNRICN